MTKQKVCVYKHMEMNRHTTHNSYTNISQNVKKRVFKYWCDSATLIQFDILRVRVCDFSFKVDVLVRSLKIKLSRRSLCVADFLFFYLFFCFPLLCKCAVLSFFWRFYWFNLMFRSINLFGQDFVNNLT